jgi:hypothetical protein
MKNNKMNGTFCYGLLISPIFMWLLPHGSFNPTEFGFYYAILVGISTSYLSTWSTKKGLKWLSGKSGSYKDSS